MTFGDQRRIGAFKAAKSAGPSAADAEGLAATAFAVLAEDPPRLTRFMRDTGIEADDLRQTAGSPEFLIAILEHVLGDESLLLVVATQANCKPEALAQALSILQRPTDGSQ